MWTIPVVFYASYLSATECFVILRRKEFERETFNSVVGVFSPFLDFAHDLQTYDVGGLKNTCVGCHHGRRSVAYSYFLIAKT